MRALSLIVDRFSRAMLMLCQVIEPLVTDSKTYTA